MSWLLRTHWSRILNSGLINFFVVNSYVCGYPFDIELFMGLLGTTECLTVRNFNNYGLRLKDKSSLNLILKDAEHFKPYCYI